MKNIRIEKFLPSYSVLYLQALECGFDPVTINKITEYNTTLIKSYLDDFKDLNSNKVSNAKLDTPDAETHSKIIEFPMILLFLSPFFDPIVIQGEACYNVWLEMIERLENPHMLSPLPKIPRNEKYINQMLNDIVRCLCYKAPKIKHRDADKSVLEYYDFCKNGKPTEKLIRTLGLNLTKDQIFQKLAVVNSKVII